MTQVPHEPEVVLPEGRGRKEPGALPKMVHEPEIVDLDELTEVDERAGGDTDHAAVETVVQEPDVARAEQED